jgi:DNA-binding transcriptional MerR regulator
MSHFTLTIDDLENQTGLTRKYIDRCYARFGSLLERYRKKSADQNKYLYSSSAVAIFLQIRDFKEAQHMKLPEIRDLLQKELGSPDPGLENDREVPEKDLEHIPTTSPNTDVVVSALKDAYLLAINSEQGRVKMLEESLEMRQKRESEHLTKIASFQDATKRRGELLSDLEELDGKFFSTKKKQAVIREIRKIDREALAGPTPTATSARGESINQSPQTP